MSPFASRSVRILSILAATCLVVAFALAITLPPSASLAQVLLRARMLEGVEASLRSTLPDWAWHHLATPVLSRPSWLLPVDAALVLGGVAATIALRRARAG